jgi:hypothetical protein
MWPRCRLERNVDAMPNQPGQRTRSTGVAALMGHGLLLCLCVWLAARPDDVLALLRAAAVHASRYDRADTAAGVRQPPHTQYYTAARPLAHTYTHTHTLSLSLSLSLSHTHTHTHTHTHCQAHWAVDVCVRVPMLCLCCAWWSVGWAEGVSGGGARGRQRQVRALRKRVQLGRTIQACLPPSACSPHR